MMGKASRQKGESRMFVVLRNALLLSVCLIIVAGQAGAVALGKIEVTSHLGENFFAEAPLQLDAGEKITDVTVEMAAPSDYQILEVFRDPALSNLTVDIVNDLRGPRATISSNQAIDTPYFNLVLKLRHGHATNFKKFPVFLDLPDKVRPAAPVAQPQPVQAAPVEQAPAVSAVDVRPVESVAPAYQAEPAPAVDAAAEAAIEATGSEFNPYEGWARTSRYGPMVRGDTVTTVAQRLRIDERYTLNQVMVGLFNKNKDKFREGNINLINAGTYLNVPSAAEVESIPASQAETLIKEQEQRWKNLRNQPVYAAEAEAQENRYRTRVHVGQSASGSAAAPMQQQNMQAQPEAQLSEQPMAQNDASAEAAAEQMRALQEENLRLQQALEASESRAATAAPSSADAAAAEAQAKKLEMTVARLQKELMLVNQQLQEVKSQDMNALTYAMAAIIVLLIGVAGYLLFLLRSNRPHPVTPESENEAADVMQAAVAPSVEPVTDEVTEAVGDFAAMDSEEFAASLDAESGVDAGNQAADNSLLFENNAPTAQAGVDYLAEAEVYLRYGMDDEALQQMHLAIEQKPDQLQAHSKLVQFLQSRGDQLALAAAIEAARSALSANDLEAFEKLQAGETGEAADLVQDMVTEQADGDVHIEDVLDMGDFGDQDEAASDETVMDDVATDEVETAALDVADMEFGSSEPELASSEAGIDLSDLQLDDPEASASVVDEQEGGPGFDIDEAESSVASGLEDDSDDALDFVSSIDISEAQSSEESATDEVDSETETETEPEEAEGGIDFASAEASDDDTDLDDVLNALAADDEQESDAGALDFEASLDDTAQADDDEIDGEIKLTDIHADISDDDDDLGLDTILGEFGADDQDEAGGVDFASAGSGVTSFQPDEEEESVPETVIDSDASDELGIDEILGEFAMHESPGESADSDDEAVTETIIEAGADDDDLGLDDILGEFESYSLGTESDVSADDADTASASSDEAEMPSMDVSDELDGLLAEWGEEGNALDFETGPESLDLDKARSLLAEGSLDDAEVALRSALDGERRGDALIGLAEVAAKRGDAEQSSELLAEAESLLDDSNRDWFDSVKNLSA